MQQLQNIIETAFERHYRDHASQCRHRYPRSVNQVIALLDSGALRVAEKLTVSG